MKRLITYIALLCAAFGCVSNNNEFDIASFYKPLYTPQYATGFQISYSEKYSSTLISVKNPWQGANNVEQMLIIDPKNKLKNLPQNIKHITQPARRIVCMSSSYVAMLAAIGCQQNIVGVSGIDFISNEYISINRDKIGDVGYDNNINYELLVSLNPDLVLLYGVTGASAMESKLQELGIPYIYLGEYVESSPLGKAEWLVAVGEIAGKREIAQNKFNEIATRYEELCQKTRQVENKPRVMLNTPYRDSWFIPSEQSYMVELIRDAGADCYTCSAEGNTSQPIDMEQAYTWAAGADYWLNVGPCNSLGQLTSQNPKFANIKAVTEMRVYNNNARQTPKGGSDFWESGVIRPDIILRDLTAIFHPEIGIESTQTPSHKLYYYQQLK